MTVGLYARDARMVVPSLEANLSRVGNYTISDHNIVPDHSLVLFNLPAHFPSNYHKILYTSFSGVC